MRRRAVYFLMMTFLAVCALLKAAGPSGGKNVVESGMEALWQPEWFSIISRQVNERGVRFYVDGKEIAGGKYSVRMSENGQFQIPSEMLPGCFSCTSLFYDNSRLVMEKGEIHAELSVGSSELLADGETFALSSSLERDNGTLYVPLEAVEKAFSYEREWDASENILKLTGKGGELILPVSYDYRQEGRAPQVKNQGSLGTCWAFASMMALESSLLPEQQADFSEDHMSLQNSFHLDQNAGGDYTMSMAYLLAWQGPVPEEEDVYGDGYSPPDLKPVCHVQEIQVLPEKDYEAVKKAVYLTGGVQSSLYTSMADGENDRRYYNKETGAYCYTGDEKPNHDVVIIGWDDTYPRENFNEMPEGDGAFICANSWGGDFGNEGYFYVSYYDSNIGIHNILYARAESTDNYDSIYQTDLCGWVGQLGYGREHAYFANIYTAREKEELAAVGFYATGPHTSYEVYTVRDVQGSAQFSRRRLAASGTLENAGYYTIDLRHSISLEAGERFAVIVSVSTPGAVHPVAVEYNSPDKELRVDLSDGEGYISYRGSVWEQVESGQDCNVCLKAYTRFRRDEEE